MLSRTKRIDGFHLKLSRTEKELYEEFLKNEEAALVLEMQQHFRRGEREHEILSFRSSSGRRRKGKLRKSKFGLNRLGEKPNPSGSGNRDRYNRNHLAPAPNHATSIKLDPNPLGRLRRITGGRRHRLFQESQCA